METIQNQDRQGTIHLFNHPDLRDLHSSNAETIEIKGDGFRLEGELTLSPQSEGLVLFAHGSGSSRLSKRNQYVARRLEAFQLGTFLFDLLSEEEAADRSNVFNISLLADRLLLALYWLQEEKKISDQIPIGFFGASTGGAAALWAAASLGDKVSAVVSRGGRPDLALPQLTKVTAPSLLIVGGDDEPVLTLNFNALHYLPHGEIEVIPNATHLFEEPGALEKVADLAARWFSQHFRKSKAASAA
ncbi:MAG: phosphoribosyltransferase [Bacteriovoracaceae bacterium]|nr:phosphoribosyltransferase [Bacteriovoracaceae bacterium]